MMSTEHTDVLSVVLLSIFSFLVLFTNIIVIIKSRELHLPTLWNIAVMAAWDLAFGLYGIVFILPSKILNAFAYPDSFGIVASTLMSFIATQNILNIVIALVDRCVSVCWPLHYPRLMSAKRFTLAHIIALLINIVRACVALQLDGDGSYNKSLGVYTQDKSTLVMSLSLGLLLIIAVILVMFLIRMRLELGKRNRNLNTGPQQAGSSQFTYATSISTIVFIVCYIPSFIAILVSKFMNEERVILAQIGFICVFSNSLWNVFIYSATYRPFRDAFLRLFCPT